MKVARIVVLTKEYLDIDILANLRVYGIGKSAYQCPDCMGHRTIYLASRQQWACIDCGVWIE